MFVVSCSCTKAGSSGSIRLAYERTSSGHTAHASSTRSDANSRTMELTDPRRPIRRNTLSPQLIPNQKTQRPASKQTKPTHENTTNHMKRRTTVKPLLVEPVRTCSPAARLDPPVRSAPSQAQRTCGPRAPRSRWSPGDPAGSTFAEERRDRSSCLQQLSSCLAHLGSVFFERVVEFNRRSIALDWGAVWCCVQHQFLLQVSGS